MTTLSIHNLDPELERRVRRRAREKHQSLNKTLHELLGQALGVSPSERSVEQRFARFCGVWSDEDVAVFEEATADLQDVDPADWQ